MLLVFGAASFVGVPLLVWRAQADGNMGDAAFAAFGHGLCAGVLAGLLVGFWYLRRGEAERGELLVFGGGKGAGKQYFVR
jgi:hypothetical protein